jgi:hypothetical protein
LGNDCEVSNSPAQGETLKGAQAVRVTRISSQIHLVEALSAHEFPLDPSFRRPQGG